MTGQGRPGTPAVEIRLIEARETWPVRHAVLRIGQPLSSCDYDIDNMPGSFHLGLHLDQELVCIGSFYPDPHPELPALQQFRLRGMATLQAQQGQGHGMLLLQHAIHLLLNHDCELLWCNARLAAVGYYLKFGMQRHGPEFDIPGIGPHWLMYRELDPDS
jgi:predicted GNAT family N-acyltransferase